jgi:cobalt-zinc-cadmium efflux system membrane fusion protein
LALTIALAPLILALAACNRPAPSGAAEMSEGAAATAEERHDGHAGDVHAESDVREHSDLDRPTDELFNATCEHGKKTFECDECRYEIGVVHAPASLFSGGLLHTETVIRERVEIPLVLTGEVRFDERRVTHVNTQADGIIRKIHVALGDAVKKGQALVEIESIAVGEAQGAYLEAETVLRLARRNYERLAALRKEAISSEKEYLQAKQELEAVEIRTDGALRKLTRLGMDAGDAAALDRASARGRLLLRAPADGTVLTLHAVPGEVAKTDQSLATIGDNAVVWVWADLYERDIARVTRAQQEKKLSAAVAVKAYPGEEFPGTVDFISPSMEEASRTVRLRVEVANPDGRLLAGMFANVKLFLHGEEETIALSESAVLEDEGRSFVFIHHHDDYYVRRPVVPGRAWAGRIEVVNGLKGGETVVTDGSFLLKSDVLRSKMGAGCAD